MPDFENLEPFLDRDGGHILPVAPHSTSAHDFVLKRREARPERAARRQSGTPDPIAVTGAPQLTTHEMEKAYRAAIKESRGRQKSQARKQGKTAWSRFTRWLASFFGNNSATAPRKGKQPKGPERPHQRRSKKAKDGEAAPQHASSPRNDGPGDTADGSRSSRSRSRNRPRNRNRQRTPEGGAPQPKLKGEQSGAGKDPSGKIGSGKSPSSEKDGTARPRRRRNRRRPSGDTPSAPASSSKPRPTE